MSTREQVDNLRGNPDSVQDEVLLYLLDATDTVFSEACDSLAEDYSHTVSAVWSADRLNPAYGAVQVAIEKRYGSPADEDTVLPPSVVESLAKLDRAKDFAYWYEGFRGRKFHPSDV